MEVIGKREVKEMDGFGGRCGTHESTLIVVRSWGAAGGGPLRGCYGRGVGQQRASDVHH